MLQIRTYMYVHACSYLVHNYILLQHTWAFWLLNTARLCMYRYMYMYMCSVHDMDMLLQHTWAFWLLNTARLCMYRYMYMYMCSVHDMDMPLRFHVICNTYLHWWHMVTINNYHTSEYNVVQINIQVSIS